MAVTKRATRRDSAGDPTLHAIQIIVQLAHIGKNLLSGQGLDNVEYFLDLRLEIEQDNLARRTLSWPFGLGDNPDAHAGDILERGHIEYQGVRLSCRTKSTRSSSPG